ncbi:MAG: 3-deoxy-7-phosphoheptulonate synthase [Gammaproteobacteria bacterium]|nr:3-deoxy-7-phosphoheptulonate synthase [Gammaproteobacteria bacterium]
MFQLTDDLRIAELRPLVSPAILMEELPISEEVSNLVARTRASAGAIIRGEDDRLLVIVGPCSIHDPDAALDYARRLVGVAGHLQDDLLVIMRVYFEKPRTKVGWKGLINDPNLDNSFNINAGLRKARKLLIDLGAIGLPAGSEFLDTITPQFIADLVSWGAIGARTTESQVHRELASGLSMPVGFKNGTDGNIQIAIDAIGAAQSPHHFLSVTKQGISAIVSTTGNDCCHLILRGASNGSNYSEADIKAASKKLCAAKVTDRVMVDFSHGNSDKDYARQIMVAEEVCRQLADGSRRICGVMIESNLKAGKQALKDAASLEYGLSVTDACISWEMTEPVLESLAAAVRQRREA